jgi:hypothetical protein
MSECGPSATVQNHWQSHGGGVHRDLSTLSKTNDELTITSNIDHNNRRSDDGGRAIPTVPHASVETVPRFYVRCYGLERPLSCSPWRQDIRRGADGASDGPVVAGHSRRSLYSWSWDLCCKWSPL